MTSAATYAELLRALSRSEAFPCQRFVTPHGILARTSHDVLQQATRRGSQLASMGLGVGDKVALIVTEPSDFLPLIHGCLLFGMVAVPMYPPPLFGRLDTYRETLLALLEVAGAKVAVTDAGLTQRVGELPVAKCVEVERLPNAPLLEPATFGAEQLGLLQFTSGSTSRPRGVKISHRALIANAHAIMVDGLGATGGDRGVSWLPLYHDMGLIGFGLAPLLTRTPVTFIPTARFVRSPNIWLQTIADIRATITFAPNFAYALVTKRATAVDLDLSCVRMWGCGAEPVSERVLTSFERRFERCGVRAGSVAPCYGLAEATLAVTFTPPGGPRVSETIDSAVWETAAVAQPGKLGLASPEHDAQPGSVGLTYVACGRPLPNYSVRIVDEIGRELGEGHAGEVVISGPSLGEGYEGDVDATERAFRVGGLHTGDRGFLRDGQLFVTGRIKDTLIANGRKYDPTVLEHCAEQAPGVRRAAAVNIATEDGEALVVLVECGSSENHEQLAESVRAAIAANIGVAVTRVVCVALQALPRTTSGKVRRDAAKALVTPE